MTTNWQCDRCGAAGRVRFTAAESAYTVLARVIEAHRRCGKPLGCDTGTKRVRVNIPRGTQKAAQR